MLLPLPTMSAVPWVAPVTPVTVRGSPLASESLASTSTTTSVMQVVAAVSAAATGSTLAMVMVTVAVSDPPAPSVIV